ncbi:MAG TPA: methyltransferase [Steroidobacter sp.]|uniref:methyltransferase n=1 Tax=Caballeronia sp. LP003 TaxID=3038551 RepID=UPI002865E4C8|nr:methyltransferase [Caballeronia sp. LP003]MDR5786617.1 methyltransferase [Caballeronia sp. LP003]HWK48724.1 methyltransferase [Steroidobacter sp.]
MQQLSELTDTTALTMTQKFDFSRFFNLDPSTRVWTRRERAAFDYTDGAAQEQFILDALRRTGDVSSGSTELFAHMVDWPSTYHFSPRRGNLLRPFASWFAGKRVLEIGCGCGAITRFLGESDAQVVSVEGSMMRATIARERCRDLDNVDIICATSEQAGQLGQFDAVLLIGVLEYARKFLGPRGTQRLLDGCRAQLADDGVLFVAIENQLGLKYFAGAGEDHVGIPMFGVEERYDDEGVMTFGRRELAAFISGAGFPVQQWWYPFPDYKLPLCVLNEKAVAAKLGADFGPMIARASMADLQRPAANAFALERAWQPVYRNGIAGELSNSFLVLASKTPLEIVASGAVAFHYAVDRISAYAKASAFHETPEGAVEVRTSYLRPAAAADDKVRRADTVRAAFIDGTPWQDRLNRMLALPGWTEQQFVDWYATWARAASSFAGIDPVSGIAQLSTRVDARFVEALPRNLVVSDDGAPHFFGLEWTYGESIELGYMLFRGLYCSLMELRSVAVPAAGTATRFDALFERALNSLGADVRPAVLARYLAEERDFELRTQGRSAINIKRALDAELNVVPATLENYGRLRNEVVHLAAVCAEREGQIRQLEARLGSIVSQTVPCASKDELQGVQQELNTLRADHAALLESKWNRLRAALLERPRSAKQLAKVACLIVSLMTPGPRR